MSHERFATGVVNRDGNLLKGPLSLACTDLRNTRLLLLATHCTSNPNRETWLIIRRYSDESREQIRHFAHIYVGIQVWKNINRVNFDSQSVLYRGYLGSQHLSEGGVPGHTY